MIRSWPGSWPGSSPSGRGPSARRQGRSFRGQSHIPAIRSESRISVTAVHRRGPDMEVRSTDGTGQQPTQSGVMQDMARHLSAYFQITVFAHLQQHEDFLLLVNKMRFTGIFSTCGEKFTHYAPRYAGLPPRREPGPGVAPLRRPGMTEHGAGRPVCPAAPATPALQARGQRYGDPQARHWSRSSVYRSR